MTDTLTHAPQPEPRTRPKTAHVTHALSEWLVLAYLAADNNLEGELLSDLAEMERVGSTPGVVEILAQVDRARGEDTSKGNWYGTRRYYVTRGADRRKINSRLLADLADAPLSVRCPRGRGARRALLGVDAGPAVVAHYEDEARRVGVATIIAELVSIVAHLALAEEASETDALEHADRLGDGVEGVNEGGRVAQAAMQPEAEAAPPAVQWHALGTVQPEWLTCPVCRAVFEGDDESSDLPACAACGTRDTWESRQGGRFRGIVGAIDACPSLDALAALGKRLYALALLPDQASVAWSHYHVRKTALEQVVTLRPPACALVASVERATSRSLPQLGARLYRLQHAGAAPITITEWRRIWAVYRGRRAAIGP